MLPRITRFFDAAHLQELIILLVACFSQLDVVQNSAVLDTLEDTPERREVEAQTTAFLGSVMQSIMPTTALVSTGTLSAFLYALTQYNNLAAIARTRVRGYFRRASPINAHEMILQPGIALLTMFISRAETINQERTAGSSDPAELPSEKEWDDWCVRVPVSFYKP